MDLVIENIDDLEPEDNVAHQKSTTKDNNLGPGLIWDMATQVVDRKSTTNVLSKRDGDKVKKILDVMNLSNCTINFNFGHS